MPGITVTAITSRRNLRRSSAGGVSPNILDASGEALVDSIEYGAARHSGDVLVPGLNVG